MLLKDSEKYKMVDNDLGYFVKLMIDCVSIFNLENSSTTLSQPGLHIDILIVQLGNCIFSPGLHLFLSQIRFLSEYAEVWESRRMDKKQTLKVG